MHDPMRSREQVVYSHNTIQHNTTQANSALGCDAVLCIVGNTDVLLQTSSTPLEIRNRNRTVACIRVRQQQQQQQQQQQHTHTHLYHASELVSVTSKSVQHSRRSIISLFSLFLVQPTTTLHCIMWWWWRTMQRLALPLTCVVLVLAATACHARVSSASPDRKIVLIHVTDGN
jgi:hypothetical protein